MQKVIICLPGRSSARASSAYSNPGAESTAEALQAIVLARALGGKPLLICGKESLLYRAAMEDELPCIPIGSHLGGIFHIWNWQRKFQELHIICIGEEALKTGLMLAKMSQKRKPLLDLLFLLSSPTSKKGLNNARNIICGDQFIGNSVKDLLASSGKPMARVHIAQPGISLMGYDCPDIPRQQSRRIFGMDNSLKENSGALVVIRSMAALWQAANLIPWEVRMYGIGDRFEEIMAEAEKMGVSSRLCILGKQPLSEAACQCDIWLAPGKTLLEPPQTLWAGFAAGCPVILSDTPLHKERSWNYKAGFAVAPDNPQELARAILAILGNSELRDTLAQKSSAMRPLISLKGMAKRICSILEARI